jgi:hypothetical protein
VKSSGAQLRGPIIQLEAYCNHLVLRLERGSEDGLLSSSTKPRGRAMATKRESHHVGI